MKIREQLLNEFPLGGCFLEFRVQGSGKR